MTDHLSRRRLAGLALAAAMLLAQAAPAAATTKPAPKCVGCFVIFVPPIAASKGKTILASRGVVSVEPSNPGGAWLVTFAESVRNCALIATMRTNHTGTFGFDEQPVVVSTSLKSDKVVEVVTWFSDHAPEQALFVGFHLAPVC